jgi:hypothetical protein
MTMPPAPRLCGRCRKTSPGDTGGDVDPLPKWWLCESCRLAFFGAHPRRGPLTNPGVSTDARASTTGSRADVR